MQQQSVNLGTKTIQESHWSLHNVAKQPVCYKARPVSWNSQQCYLPALTCGPASRLLVCACVSLEQLSATTCPRSAPTNRAALTDVVPRSMPSTQAGAGLPATSLPAMGRGDCFHLPHHGCLYMAARPTPTMLNPTLLLAASEGAPAPRAKGAEGTISAVSHPSSTQGLGSLGWESGLDFALWLKRSPLSSACALSLHLERDKLSLPQPSPVTCAALNETSTNNQRNESALRSQLSLLADQPAAAQRPTRSATPKMAPEGGRTGATRALGAGRGVDRRPPHVRSWKGKSRGCTGRSCGAGRR